MLKVTLKELIAHRLRFALTALAVLLGVAFISGTLVLNDTIKRTFDNLFADVNRGTDAYVRAREKLSGGFRNDQRARVPASLVPAIETVRDTATAEGHVQFYAQLVDKKGDPIGNPGQGAPTFGFNWLGVSALNPFRIEAGGHAPHRADEVVIDAASAKDGHLRVGDEVTVLTQGPPKKYRITGIAKFGTADSPAGASIALFETKQAQAIIGATDQFDSISVVAKPDVSQTALQHAIEQKLHDRKLEVLTGQQITKENQSDIQKGFSFFNTALLVFAAVALFVGSFIIFNTFSIVVAQRTREMALLRAIGASGRQVMGSVLGESLLVGLGASAIGLMIGIVLSNALKALITLFGFGIPGGRTVVAAGTVVIALAAGTIVTVVSALVPARRAARVPPVAAIRDVAVEGKPHTVRRTVIGCTVLAVGIAALFAGLFGGTGIQAVGLGAFLVFMGVFVLGPLVARPLSRLIGWPLPRVRGVTGTLARENAMRNPRRTSATAAALMIGVALVGFITIFAASAKRSINVQVDRAFKADYVVTTGGGFGGFGGFSPRLADDISRLPQIAATSPLRFNRADFAGAGKFFVAVEPKSVDALFSLDRKAGSFTSLGTNGVAVSEKLARDHHWRVGSKVSTKFPDGTRDLTVRAIYGNGQREGLSDYALSIAAFNAHYTDQLDSQVYAKLKSGVSPSQGKRAIDKVLKPYANAKLQDRTEFKDAQAAQINQVLGLVYALLFLAVVIALIGIANTLALSIYERTRELGLLRAVGMTRRQTRSTVRWESVIIALLGTVLGLLIGLFFGWVVVKALKDQGFSEFAPPGAQLVLGVVVGALAGVIAAVFPARRAAKLDVLRAITLE